MLSRSQLQAFFIDFLNERGVSRSVDNIDSFNFLASGQLDSFEILSMLIHLEVTFGVKLTAEEISDDTNATAGGVIQTLLAKAL